MVLLIGDLGIGSSPIDDWLVSLHTALTAYQVEGIELLV